MSGISQDAQEIYKIAYDQGLARLDSQESNLSALRQRATTIISISGLAATLFGREALAEPSGTTLWLDMGAYEWLAVACFGVSLLCTIEVLRPKGGWHSHFTPSGIIYQFAEGEKATTLSNTYKVLAEFSEDNFEKNMQILHPLYIWFNISLFAVVMQIFFWVVAIR